MSFVRLLEIFHGISCPGGVFHRDDTSHGGAGRLKIAQELVFRVDSDFRNATVVRSAIRLAHELGIECVAEGVETEAQARFLVSAGCMQGQGFYFSRPVDAKRATELLRRGRTKPTPDLLRVVETTAA